MEKQLDKVAELDEFYNQLSLFHAVTNQVLNNKKPPDSILKEAFSLHETIERKVGYLEHFITELSEIDKVDLNGKDYDVWLVALKLPIGEVGASALSICLQATNRAIGKLKHDINTGKRDKTTGELIATQNVLKSERTTSDVFNEMRFHPKIINVSESLFKNGHYSQAIFEAYKVLEEEVREKSGLKDMFGKNLMTRAFDENQPRITVLESGKFDKEVQEGFKFMFMGASLGIRNPKAHHHIQQNDPYITLEYLGFASFLLKRIDGFHVRLEDTQPLSPPQSYNDKQV